MNWCRVKHVFFLFFGCLYSLSSLASGAMFTNPFTGQPHKFVAANYTDLGVNSNGSMPTDKFQLQANASEDLTRLKNLGVTNVRVWANIGYNETDYTMQANRIKWLAEIALSKQITLTVDLIDSSGRQRLSDIQGRDAHINNVINTVIVQNANKNYLYWSLGNEIGGYDNPLGFAAYYESKVALMRQKGAMHISFQPVPGSLEHRWNGDTREAAIRVINASDDVSPHFYALKTPQTEAGSTNALEFSSMQQWIALAHDLCKPAIIGEFSIDLPFRTDANVTAWLNYFRDTLKVDMVSFWQFTKNEGGHVDPLCFCDLPNVGNGPHISAMQGYLGAAPTYPGTNECSQTRVNFQTGINNPLYMQANHGQYLSSENGNNFVIANRSALGDWEKFTIHPNPDGTFSILGNNQRYLDVDRSADHKLKFNNTDRYCSDCKFTISLISGDTYSVRPIATNLYLSSENGQTFARANRSARGPWEIWTIKNISTESWKTISTGGELPIGTSHYSHNGTYRLTMQSDGNLVLYHQNGTPVWHTFTYGNQGSKCFMQSDGNLVIYHPNGTPLWHTHTYNNPGAVLQISNEGKIRIIRNGVVLWQS